MNEMVHIKELSSLQEHEMSFLNAISNKFSASAERRGRRMARTELLNMSDRQLNDFGVSRHLLIEGISAWPWREASAEELTGEGLASIPAITNVRKSVIGTKDIEKAVKELSSFSDRELAELGVTHHSIEESVRYDRPAIEGTVEEQRHVA